MVSELRKRQGIKEWYHFIQGYLDITVMSNLSRTATRMAWREREGRGRKGEKEGVERGRERERDELERGREGYKYSSQEYRKTRFTTITVTPSLFSFPSRFLSFSLTTYVTKHTSRHKSS